LAGLVCAWDIKYVQQDREHPLPAAPLSQTNIVNVELVAVRDAADGL